MSVISTFSFIVGGVLIISVVFVPIAWGLWKLHLRKINRKIDKFLGLEKINEGLDEFIKQC